MTDRKEEIRKGLAQILTTQYDYPPNGEGSLGYKGNNLYRFKVEDLSTIDDYIKQRDFTHSYNYEVLAQEIITDLLDDGLITYGGYGYKKQQKEHSSI